MYVPRPLPYAFNALEPVVSELTMRLHYEVLYQGYVTSLNREISRTPLSTVPIETLVLQSKTGSDISNFASQIWNHEFFWSSMTPGGSSIPKGLFRRAIGGNENVFFQKIQGIAKKAFGSAWLWVVARDDGEVLLWVGKDADNPMKHQVRPLLVCDLWEHAYYLDTPADRAGWVQNFLVGAANWRFAHDNYERMFGA